MSHHIGLSVAVSCRLGQTQISANFCSATGVTALFGPSGAGKSSLVNMIAGLVTPERGRISLNGQLLFDQQAGINLAPHKRRIGYVFQDANLFPHLSVQQNLDYGRRLASKREAFVKRDELLELLGISKLLSQRPAQLSGGEKQRVAIGRALLTSPRLLLMDEPLASLDEARKQEILPFLERLRDHYQLPIVYVSHAFDEVTRLADQLVLLEDGKLVAADSLARLSCRLDAGELLGQRRAGAIVHAHVACHDDEQGLTQLLSAGAYLWVPRVSHAVGTRLRIQLPADDVALACLRPQDISMQNVLPARIVEISHTVGSHAAIRLDASGMPLLAHVTQRAVAQLGLHQGQQLLALIKGVGILGARTEKIEVADKTFASKAGFYTGTS